MTVSLALFLEVKNLPVSHLSLGGNHISVVLFLISKKVTTIHEYLIVAACQKALVIYSALSPEYRICVNA